MVKQLVLRFIPLMLLWPLVESMPVRADDWPQWRGPLRDGVWREDGVLERFPPEGLPVRWRTPIGAGFSGPAVAGGQVFLMDRVVDEGASADVKTQWNYRDKTRGQERVLCLDEATGKILWQHTYPCEYETAYGSGPRATPTVCGQRVYTVGAMGDLFCLDSATGRVVWQKNFVRDFGADVPLYGFASPPLVDGDRLIVMVGGEGQVVMALDRHTGRELWTAGTASEPGYCAPLIRTLSGQRQLVIWHGDGLMGLEPESGKELWSVRHATTVAMAISTPAIAGNRLAVSSQYEGVLMLEFPPGAAEPTVLWQASASSAPERQWQKAGFNTTMSTVLLLDNHVYGVSLYGETCCLNGDNGQRVWTTLQPTSGGTEPRERWSTLFMVPHGDRVFIWNDHGDLILARLTPAGYEEISRAHILDPDMASAGSEGRKVTWSHPAFANRCCYVRNNHEIVCVSLAAPSHALGGADKGNKEREDYLGYVTKCLDTLIEYGTDRYGAEQTPVLVSILDTETRQCPSDPAAFDESWRVVRRERRNPAGANLLTDQPLLKTLVAVSAVTGDGKYRRLADSYSDWYLKNLVDERGFLWWGWHRHYDVYQDKMLGHLGNPHEIHAIHCIAWDQLWEVDPQAVRREIEAIWQWHVIDKTTGEVNRHGDGQRGCDFAMSAGACAYAFAFLHQRTGDPVWLDRAKLLACYYWDRRDLQTDLFADRPNAGPNRFDGSHFVTADTGLYCHALLKCYELTGVALFKDQALAYLKAYRRYGYDSTTGQFWGSLRLDGTPVAGPRLVPPSDGHREDYGVYEPRGYLDLWQPYVAGYEHPLATAQVYAFAFSLTDDPAMLDTAELFATLLEANLPPRACLKESWYRDYAERYAPEGTYAGLYGQSVSFLLHMYVLTGEPRYLRLAVETADDAIARLFRNGLFCGHPAKPYYEAVDGVGYLLYALLELDQVVNQPELVLSQKKIVIGQGPQQTTLPMDDW